jgi:hypothetical protein
MILGIRALALSENHILYAIEAPFELLAPLALTPFVLAASGLRLKTWPKGRRML